MNDPTFHLVQDRRITRRNMEAAIAAATMPVRFVECEMDGEDFSGLDLSGYVFERCAIIQCDLRGARAERTVWKACRARQARVTGADMADSTFAGGDWNNVDFDGAQIGGARFEGVKLTGSSFQGAKTFGTTFLDCLMAACDLRGLSFRKRSLGRCDMSRSNIAGVDFRDAGFAEGSSLAGASLADSVMAGADLRNVDLSGLGLGVLPMLKGARITAMQAAGIVSDSGIKVG